MPASIFSNACPECESRSNHEKWCPRINPTTAWVRELVDNPGQLSDNDRLILHGLGVKWDNKKLPKAKVDEGYDPA